MNGIRIFDDFLPDPTAYREQALRGEFRSFDFPECTFHGISFPAPALVPEMISEMMPGAVPNLSFFRKSPKGQEEPHYIHTDVDMGRWSAILYLNEQPESGDGTAFWTHNESGRIGSMIPHEFSTPGKSAEGWTRRRWVEGKFNRLMVFSSDLFHSRSIFDNWGENMTARLTQVTFGTGEI